MPAKVLWFGSVDPVFSSVIPFEKDGGRFPMHISAAVLDFYDDSKHQLMSKIAMPAEVRGVNVTELTPEQHAALPDNEFGLIVLTKRAAVLRKFPVNDPGNAWLSAQYFEQNHNKLAFPARFIAARFIKQACSAYDVPASSLVDAYAARVEENEATSNVFAEGSEEAWMLRKLASREFLEKQASVTEMNAVIEMPNEHFALVIQTGDGTVIRKYAMPDSEHVKMAATYFDKYAMDLQPEYRHRFAASVMNRAAELGVDVSDNDAIYKWAGTDWNANVQAHLEQRKSLLPQNPKACEILSKLAASIHETTPGDMAEALETFDRATGLSRYYDRGLADPYSSTMEKTAEGWSAEVDGQIITAADLNKVAAMPKLASYMGETFAKQFKDHPMEVFESLPADSRVLFKQILNGEA
jgi:hypothetical protein